MVEKIEFQQAGRHYSVESLSVNISASGPAMPSNAQWYVTVDDGPESIAFDASPDDTEVEIKRRIIEWYQGREGRHRG